MRRLMLSGCIAAVLMVGFAPHVQASDGDALREMKDRAEIEALMWRYVRALDTLNENAYAAVYTPEGTFGSGANVSKGSEALKKIILDVKKRQAEQEAKGDKPTKMRHIITNSHLEFIDKDIVLEGDSARVTCVRQITAQLAVGREQSHRVQTVISLHRGPGGWLITSVR